ncbi:MAG TPA: ornithine carbamoyltransferase [Kiritimatiellia bacterium]|nr:ornithine carbamoyltransferase [Kiritimatiellia bacterium]HNR93598.1 ornithine carbamoyltransferase [Kiritimatiellia bacterium]HNS81515.1 ornithine carbamoyltransferase [Kiritimatiellia bacterium]
MRHFIALKDWPVEELAAMLDLAAEIKRNPGAYEDAMRRRVLVMIFEKPSLRTRLSFETGMCKMGGDAIYYDMSTSPLGAGKETIEDSVKTVSRYADLVMARLMKHENMLAMAKHAGIPVINGMTDYNHPCQIMADLLTISEKKGRLAGLTLSYFGDSNNNVTHSILFGGALFGMHVRVGCPAGEKFSPRPDVMKEASAIAAKSGGSVAVTHDAAEAARGADVVYTDSWMSYHIPKDQLEARVKTLTPYQVNSALMKQAKPDAIFMNCLPAMRGYEQTAEVIDGPQSVVFDEAENRMHAQNAIMLKLLEG